LGGQEESARQLVDVEETGRHGYDEFRGGDGEGMRFCWEGDLGRFFGGVREVVEM